MTKDGYPTARELKRIITLGGTFPIDTKCITKNHTKLIEHIRSIWWNPEWGFKLTGKKKLKLQLHTGGWSGNECIIRDLKTTWFWSLYWVMSKRGGHYWFEINMQTFVK
jgi:hypothetical protein